MADIFEFVGSSRKSAVPIGGTNTTNLEADIIIFPGIRYERQDFPEKRSKAAKASPSNNKNPKR